MKLIRWIQGWLETRAIRRDKELHRAAMESKNDTGPRLTMDEVKARLGLE